MSRKMLLAGGAALAGVVLVPVMLLSALVAPPPSAPSVTLVSNNQNSSVPPPKPGVMTDASVAALLYRAGFRGDDITIGVAVAHAESGLNPKATNANTNGSVDYGLFQINSIHGAILAAGNWADPGDNARMAFKVFTDAGSKWTPWVTFWSGSYRKYLGAVTVKPVCTPIPVVAGSCKGQQGHWANGRIPASALCPLWADGNHKLRADAAAKFDALAKAYAQRFGAKPCITDSYRSLAAQIDVRRRKPGLAAVPGTSNHGWGLALDLCGPHHGQWIVGSDYDVWMHQNAPKYGWVHPSWAEPSGSKPEPWHWGMMDKEHTP